MGVVELAASRANLDLDLSAVGLDRSLERAEGALQLEAVRFQRRVGQEVGLGQIIEAQVLERSSHLVPHRPQQRFRRPARAAVVGLGDDRRHAGEQQGRDGDALHRPPSCGAWSGIGRIGGLLADFARFSISISETRMLGATAETGTQPDSAPQEPLKTS
jgi:hypothetical protein